MVKIEPELEYYRKDKFWMSSGKWVAVEMKLFRLPKIEKKEYPEDYKFSWIAFNQDDPEEKVLFDNHHGKAPHFHINGQEESFVWINLEKSLDLFYQKTIQKFGRFLYQL